MIEEYACLQDAAAAAPMEWVLPLQGKKFGGLKTISVVG